ncbi:MAG TPA: efflux RND transporter periplasmic adaptor subunit [Thermoanaerobaculia bacterium]|nr:efflux RND transporter periplasmic adaptor subunit [Thermoanaerobaculia bacterium]
MKRNSRILSVLVGGAALLLVGYLAGRARRPSSATTPSLQASRLRPLERPVLYWYDPMKPEVHFDHPGKSPFMDMPLQPKYADEAPTASAAPPPGYSVVRIPLERRQEIGVTTAKVEKRVIGGSIETNGSVAEDEGRVHSVNAKFAGYIERLLVDRTGQPVKRGQPLLTIYSPDLVATERELLLAVENGRRLRASSSLQAAADAQSLLAATRQRLRLWDIPDSEIDRIEKSGEVSKTLTLDSPVSGVVLQKDAVPGLSITPGMPLYTIADLSTVWVLADVYQSEMAMAVPGNTATVSASFPPGETFPGRIDFVYPTLTEESRTIKIRIVLPNPKGVLKPGMFVRVSLSGSGKNALAIPRSALIQTGERQIAFVEESPGVYVPREIETGLSGKDSIEVLSGLSEGEMVVTSANFLIDSESRIGSLGSVPEGSAGQPVQSLGKKP